MNTNHEELMELGSVSEDTKSQNLLYDWDGGVGYNRDTPMD